MMGIYSGHTDFSKLSSGKDFSKPSRGLKFNIC